MEYVTGKDLNRIFKSKRIASFRKRFLFPELMDYLHREEDPRLCTLYGLRRTGKTTLMAQAAKKLDQDKVCWVHCEEGDDIQDVKNVIKGNPACRYFFLDEVTRLENFTSASSILADKYAAEDGKKIVLAGTDSLGFALAFGTELFDRTHILHTTYIPYAEYRYLLGENKDIDDYIEYGGTLTDGKVFYNPEGDFDYTNDAIAENIQHSLELFRDGGAFGPLLPLYARDELTTCIEKLVELDNRTFLAKNINRTFKSHDMGRLSSNLQHDKNFEDIDVTPLKNPDLIREIRDALLIKDPLLHAVSPEAVREIKRYLKRLDVIYVVPGTKEEEVIFMQPGLRYSQVRKQMDILEQSPLLKDFSPSLRKEFSKRLDEQVKGSMMEDILFVQLAKDKTLQERYRITKYRDSAGTHEFDLVIVDEEQDKAVLIEVKHSKEYLPSHQALHLIDEAACQELEKDLHVHVSGKAVIYRGENMSCTKGISYWNVNTFMDNPKGCLEAIESIYQGRGWKESLQKALRKPGWAK